MSASSGNSPRRERETTQRPKCARTPLKSPNIASLRAGHATAVSGLSRTASELAPGDSDVARSAAQVRDGVDVDQMCSLIICAAKVSARQNNEVPSDVCVGRQARAGLASAVTPLADLLALTPFGGHRVRRLVPSE